MGKTFDEWWAEQDEIWTWVCDAQSFTLRKLALAAWIASRQNMTTRDI